MGVLIMLERSLKMNEVLAVPTKGFCEILFFKSRDGLLKAVDAYSDAVFPIIGGNDRIRTCKNSIKTLIYRGIYCYVSLFVSTLQLFH